MADRRSAIDLGSYTAVIGMLKQPVNKNFGITVEIITNEIGSRETPVCIAWQKKANSERLIG